VKNTRGISSVTQKINMGTSVQWTLWRILGF